jgi:hypothetical protein
LSETSEISFSLSNQTKFEYTSTYLPVNITINTYIPSSIQKNIHCKLSGSEDQQITYFVRSDGDLHNIICNVTTNLDGLRNLSLWYKDIYHTFELSSNSLEIAFTTPKNIYSFSPPAVKQNRTTKFSVNTLFSTNTNYGPSSQYLCEYGFNKTGTFTNATILYSGVFQCDVILLTEGKAFMKIWMIVKNLMKLITFNSELFNVVNSNFFEPSYGTPLGGDKIQIVDYNDVISSIKFTNSILANKYSFNCSINGTVLTCITPNISTIDMPLYSTQDILFSNNQSISTRFILYGN